MATEANKYRVGLFLISGFLLINIGLIALGASRAFRETTTYTTYFEESVQGLDKGSPVKYRGVPLGRVSVIRVAPDGRLVQVAMDVDPKFHVQRGMRAKITTAGITGNSFVEIGFPRPGTPVKEPPRLTFPPPPNYIPSTPSLFTDILGSLGTLLETVQCMDLPGLSAEYRALAVKAREVLGSPATGKALGGVGPALAKVGRAAERLRALLADPRIDSFLEQMDEASAAAAQGSRSARNLLGDPRLAETVGDAAAAARDVRQLTAKLSTEIGSLRLGEALQAAQESIDRAARQATETLQSAETDLKSALGQTDRTAKAAHAVVLDVGRSLEAVLGRLTRTASLLESLAASLQREPSRLILEGAPPQDFR